MHNDSKINNIRRLIPKDKFDTSTLDELKKISESEVQPILPDLLEWIADMNWPIAQQLIHVLPRFSESLIPLIKERLSPEKKDNLLKYWIIASLLPLMASNNQLSIHEDVKRIAENPTHNENVEEVDEIATDYLNKYYLK